MPPANSPVNSATPVEAPYLTLNLPSPSTFHSFPRVNLPQPGAHRSSRVGSRPGAADHDSSRATADNEPLDSDGADSVRPTHLRSPSPIPPPEHRQPSPGLSTLLHTINSPVMDLASTLTVQAEQNVEDENLEFLRSIDDELQTGNYSRPDREAVARIERRHRDALRYEDLLQRRAPSTSGETNSNLEHLTRQLRNERRRLETFRAERLQQQQHHMRRLGETLSSAPPSQRPIEQRLFSNRTGQRSNEYDGERARAFREMVSDLESRGWSSNVAEETVLEGWLQFQAERAREERREAERRETARGSSDNNGTRTSTPSNRARLYGWAPGSEQLDPDVRQPSDHQVLDGFDFDSFLLNDAGAQNDNPTSTATARSRATRDEPNTHNSSQDQDSRSSQRPSSNGATTQHTDPPSLRTAALLHSVRRNPRFSPRQRDVMLRYVLDRDRTASSVLSQENGSRSAADAQRFLAAASSASEGSRYEANRLAWQAAQRSGESNSDHRTLETLRRRYVDDSSAMYNKRSSSFEQIIKFLHTEVSSLDTVEEIQKQIKKKKRGICIDSAMGRFRPPYCSWLSPGIVFSGFQQAAPSPSTATSSAQPAYRPNANQTLSPNHVPIVNPNRTFDSSRPWLLVNESNTQPRFSASPTPIAATTHTNASANPDAAATATSAPSHDQWTVKVTIHDVDYENMSLQGTMEAFNVPSLASSRSNTINVPGASSSAANPGVSSALPSNKTFCTYVEGELIDMATYTFQTESFNATPEKDATYWRKLEPFANMTDSEIANCLMDSDWVQKNVTEKYILMRWKEKCFVEGTLSSTAGVRPGAARPSPAADNHTLANSEYNQSGDAMNLSADTPSRNTEGQTSGSSSSSSIGAGGRHIVFSERDTLPTPPTNHGHSASTFLSGADGNGVGLSISGFYYVSLRRSDGWCEGLYYDPQSTPYQRLEMKPECGFGGWSMGSWSFR